MTDYNSSIDLPDTVDHGDVLDALAGYHPAVSPLIPGRLRVVLTMDAPDLATASSSAVLAVVAATGLAPLAVETMTTAEYDRRGHDEGHVLTVVEAASALGLTRQAILARIQRGTMPATRRGGHYVIPAAVVGQEQCCARS